MKITNQCDCNFFKYQKVTKYMLWIHNIRFSGENSITIHSSVVLLRVKISLWEFVRKIRLHIAWRLVIAVWPFCPTSNRFSKLVSSTWLKQGAMPRRPSNTACYGMQETTWTLLSSYDSYYTTCLGCLRVYVDIFTCYIHAGILSYTCLVGTAVYMTIDIRDEEYTVKWVTVHYTTYPVIIHTLDTYSLMYTQFILMQICAKTLEQITCN